MLSFPKLSHELQQVLKLMEDAETLAAGLWTSSPAHSLPLPATAATQHARSSSPGCGHLLLQSWLSSVAQGR